MDHRLTAGHVHEWTQGQRATPKQVHRECRTGAQAGARDIRGREGLVLEAGALLAAATAVFRCASKAGAYDGKHACYKAHKAKVSEVQADERMGNKRRGHHSGAGGQARGALRQDLGHTKGAMHRRESRCVADHREVGELCAGHCQCVDQRLQLRASVSLEARQGRARAICSTLLRMRGRKCPRQCLASCAVIYAASMLRTHPVDKHVGEY